MAVSTCPKPRCESTSFEMKELDVRGSNYQLMAVQCATCGAVVSTTDVFNLGNLLQQIKKRLGA